MSVPVIGAAQFLIRNIFLSVDPAQRGWATAAANYSDAVALGDPMRALSVGVVVDSNDTSVKPGEYYYGWFGWQDYCVAGRDKILRPVNPDRAPLSAYAGILGINGITAYLALTTLGEPRSGDTVLVSTAAGAVGSIVGQISRNLGCTTLGLTGSADKIAACTSRFGYDVALNYKSDDFPDALREACPKGIDVFFDNVGGTILDHVVRHMAIRGRIIQCGTASIASWAPPPLGLRNEREVLTRRLRWEGFVIFDHSSRFDEATEVLLNWLDRGQIIYDEDISHGIKHAPGAIASVYAGENKGKKLIFIGN
jgi:NADPH-dependent curcumin reductase CurA